MWGRKPIETEEMLAQAERARQDLDKAGLGGRIPTESDRERRCPRCGAVVPCTSGSQCIACSQGLTEENRVRGHSSRFNPSRW